MSCSYDYCVTVKEKCLVVIIATSLHVDACNSVTWCLVALYRGGHNYIIIHHVSYSDTIMTMHM